MTFTTRPELSRHLRHGGLDALARVGRRDGRARARRQRVRRGGRGRVRAAGRRAAPERARAASCRCCSGTGRGAPRVLCGQGPAPAAATDRRATARSGSTSCRARAARRRACRARSTPGCCCCATSGRCALAEVLELRDRLRGATASRSLPRDGGAIAAHAELFRAEWPSSADALAAAAARPARAAQPGAGRHLRAGSSTRRRGGATARRRSTPRATPATAGSWPRRSTARRRTPACCRRRPGALVGATLRGAGHARLPRAGPCARPGPWGQGPVFLQQLALLDGLRPRPRSAAAEHVHTVIECAKLAFADREAWYGDPARRCRSTRCCRAATRASGARWSAREASAELRPGLAGGARAARSPRGDRRRRPRRAPRRADARRHLPPRRRRPLRQHRLGHARAAAGCRARPRSRSSASASARAAQMFWLEDGLPASLAPRQAAAHDAVAVAGAARRRARAGVRHAGRRPAGPVVAAVLPRPRRVRARPAGGDRRADVPPRPLPVLVLPARGASRAAWSSRRGSATP